MRAKFIAARIVPLILTAVILGACDQPPSPPPADQQVSGDTQEYYDHTVRYSGETMALISAWYTGKGSNWTAIQQANPNLRPERIRLGQVIRIPKNVMIRNEAMPGSYVKNAAVKKPKEETAETAATAAGAETAAVPQPEAEAPQTPERAETAASAPAEMAKTEAAAAADSVPASSAPAVQQGAAPTPEDEEKERLLDELLK